MSHQLRFSARHRSFSTSARAAMLLLAILQFVAPSWHVCDMGGGRCCQCHETSAQAAPAEKPKCGPHCKCNQARGAKQATVNGDDDDCSQPFSGTCLAQLLTQMPWSQVQAFDLSFSTIEAKLAIREAYSPPSLIVTAQPLYRGPPLGA